MEEIWKAVVGYEGLYEVSNIGRVKALSNNREKKEKVLKPGKNASGYLVVALTINKKATWFVVHRLVAWSFLDGLEGKKEVNHIDGNKTNNLLSNLEVVSREENIQHAFKIGLIKADGENNNRAKFKNAQMRAIREFYKTEGCSIGHLARKHNVSQHSMSDLINNKTYKDV